VAIPAVAPAQHELKPNAIGLLQSTVIAIASSAPGQATAVSIAGLIVASSYAGGVAILITTIPMLAIAYSYHRLNLWEQDCGASYVWVGRSINPYVGFMVGWTMLAGWMLATVSDILPLGPSVLSFFGANPSGQLGTALSVVILGSLVTIVSVIGIQLTARFQLAIALIEYVILLVFCAIGFWSVFIAHSAGTVHPSAAWLSLSGVGGKGSLIAGTLIAVYLFTGWDVAIYLNEETERPERNPGMAALLSVLILGIFYTVIVVCLQGAASQTAINNHSDNAMTFIAHQLAGGPWDKFMAFAIVLSVIGTTQAFLVGTARIAYSMGTDRLLPKLFGNINHRYRTPALGTAIFGLVTVLVTLLYVYSSSVANSFDTVVTSVGVLFALFYAATGIATAWYYRALIRRSTRDGVLQGVLPVGGAAALLYIAIKSVLSFSGSALWSMIGVLLLGIVVMAIAVIRYRSPFFRLRPVAYEPGRGR
jgi:amino acid transporter